MNSNMLILGVVNSQPSGLDQKYYEEVYQKSYKPLLTVLNEFPGIPVTLYYSGTLLEWLEARHPEATMLLSEMVKRKQVELLGGGFYEPIFPVIPNSDRISHIEALTTFLRKRFGRRPRGSWLGEMFWEPNLPVSLKNSGIDYTFLDDSYFKISGVRGDDLLFPCITEDQGKTIAVFPIDSDLCTYFLENNASDSFSYLKMRLKNMIKKDSQEKTRVLSVFINSEDWQEKAIGPWLKEIFSLIETEKEDFNIQLAENCIRDYVPLKKTYFSSLVPGKVLPERKNGPKHETARNLLGFYPEINLFYSKLLYVNLLISQLRGDKSRRKTARQDLWKAQAHRLYWYPAGQGNTFRPLRQEGYKTLLSTEKMAREAGIFQPSIVLYDFDMNGMADYLFQGSSVNAYVRREGARLFELDYLEKPWNYQDTHCHWMEPRGNRDSFIDAFYNGEEHPKKNEAAGGFSLDKILYNEVLVDKDKQKVTFNLEMKIPDVHGKKRPILLVKEYSFNDNGVNVLYEIKNLSEQELEFHFSSELNLYFASFGPDLGIDYISRGRKKSDFAESGNYRDIKQVGINDQKNKTAVTITSSKNCELVTSTRDVIDEDYGRLYQGTRFLLCWKKKAEPQKSWIVELSLGFNKI